MRLIRFSIINFWLIIYSSVNGTNANSSLHLPTLPPDLHILTCESLPDTLVDIKNLGLEILNGLPVSQIDEKYIYQLMDSIMASDSLERSFYFNVYNKIYEQSTEYIYYEIGFSIKEFLFKFPDEFFCLPETRLKVYAFEIGELFRTEEEFPLEAAQKYVSEIENRCSVNNLKKLKEFNKDMLEVVESKK